jgi:DNA-binding FadR family transcriptional regulator
VFAPVRRRRTFEEAVAQIADAVQAGEFHVGDRLPSERDLAEQMQISRPTLREAVRVLSESGVIEVRPGPSGGMFVKSEVVPLGLVETRSQMRVSEVSGVLEARRLFEPRVAQLAALYGTEEDFETLQKTIDLQREVEEDHIRALSLDFRFHLQMARATKNPTIVGMMRTLLTQLEIARDMALRISPGEPHLAIEIHEGTLAAIMSGDSERIEQAMDEHMSFLERTWEEESGRARLNYP